MSFIIFPGVITPPLTPGAVPYGTGSTVLMSAQGTAGQVLLSTGAGAPVWGSTVPSTAELAGGVAGDLPYQQAPNDTTFLNLSTGGVLYGAAAAPAYTAIGTAGQVLQSNGTSAPSWTTNISGNAANVTGTVAVGNGGTGATTLTANNVIIGNATSPVNFVAPGTTGNVLTSNGTTWTSAAASSGSYQLVSVTTGTGITTLNITSGFTSTYQAYVIYFRQRHSAGTTLTIRYYNNSSLVTSNYSSTVQYNQLGSTSITTVSGGTTSWLAFANTNKFRDIIINIENPDFTELVPIIYNGVDYEFVSSGYYFRGGGWNNAGGTNGPLTGIQFTANTNCNMTAYLYGIKP
jgi:hypothetical protein